MLSSQYQKVESLYFAYMNDVNIIVKLNHQNEPQMLVNRTLYSAVIASMTHHINSKIIAFQAQLLVERNFIDHKIVQAQNLILNASSDQDYTSAINILNSVKTELATETVRFQNLCKAKEKDRANAYKARNSVLLQWIKPVLEKEENAVRRGQLYWSDEQCNEICATEISLQEKLDDILAESRKLYTEEEDYNTHDKALTKLKFNLQSVSDSPRFFLRGVNSQFFIEDESVNEIKNEAKALFLEITGMMNWLSLRDFDYLMGITVARDHCGYIFTSIFEPPIPPLHNDVLPQMFVQIEEILSERNNELNKEHMYTPHLSPSQMSDCHNEVLGNSLFPLLVCNFDHNLLQWLAAQQLANNAIQNVVEPQLANNAIQNVEEQGEEEPLLENNEIQDGEEQDGEEPLLENNNTENPHHQLNNTVAVSAKNCTCCILM